MLSLSGAAPVTDPSVVVYVHSLCEVVLPNVGPGYGEDRAIADGGRVYRRYRKERCHNVRSLYRSASLSTIFPAKRLAHTVRKRYVGTFWASQRHPSRDSSSNSSSRTGPSIMNMAPLGLPRPLRPREPSIIQGSRVHCRCHCCHEGVQ